MIKLSILIPYYNTYDYTIKLLKELSIQRNEQIEVILIDDGCNETRFDVFSDFKIIHLKKNVGMSSALNVGLDNAKGEYIGFVDSDDMITMDYIDILLETLKEHDEQIIYFNWADFNNNCIVTHPTNYALWKAIYKFNIFPRFEEGRRENNDVPVQKQLRENEYSEFYIDRVLYIYNSNRVESITWKANERRRKEMLKLETIKNFTLNDYEKLSNVERLKGPEIKGQLNVGDTFECEEDMAKYLMGNNALGEVVAKVIEIKPEKEPKDEVSEEVVQAVANAIVGEAEEQDKKVEEIVNEIVEESKEELKEEPKEEPKIEKNNKKKKNK